MVKEGLRPPFSFHLFGDILILPKSFFFVNEKILARYLFFSYHKIMKKEFVKITIKLRKKGVWSQRHDSCQNCNTVDKKHFAHGLCETCYNSAYREAQKIKKNAAKKKNNKT